MDASAELVFHWRRKIVELLSSPMESEAVPVPNQGQKDNKEKEGESGKGKEKEKEMNSERAADDTIEIDKEGDNESGEKSDKEEAEVEEDQYTKALKAQGEGKADRRDAVRVS